MIKTIECSQKGIVRILDQSRLPQEEVYIECRSHLEVAEAIRDMRIRGAPAIGVAAAMGLALAAQNIAAESFDGFYSRLKEAAETLARTRPTAVNLFWALRKMERCALDNKELSLENLKERLMEEAQRVLEGDVQSNRAIGLAGRSLIPDGASILTHCNTGALATAGYGSALGIVRAAFEEGKRLTVYVDETRPYLQGARLTAWELHKEGIPFVLITDSAAGYLMKLRKIDLVLVGADRIAVNGDVANKIGTYSLAVLAHEHGVPFYVAAPLSTFDVGVSSGEEIPIEERNHEEVTHFMGIPIAPEGARAFNPAFDITPGRLVSAFITEQGVIRPPYMESLKGLYNARASFMR